MFGIDIAKTLGSVQHAIQDAVQSIQSQDVALNPQPLPPSPADIFERLPSGIADIFGRGEEVGLNPQPLPPSPADLFERLPSGIADIFGRGEEVGLNPQPLPPEPPEDYLQDVMMDNPGINPDLSALFPEAANAARPLELPEFPGMPTRIGEAVIDWDSVELPATAARLIGQDFQLPEQSGFDPSAFGTNPVFEQAQPLMQAY